ncbi:MAG TPA: DUF1254 domain-containing protein [Nocardioides sp.]|uniref:DUF1254 domain-containing protein n=1 Tax=uncultured Nocardioides sp. TaxID=198441 RepID=UPI002631B271|nr:DUF1254 domain-containing protein [uncultured Nocardioides sp.]HRD59945.1 DUF1254 domain-containing protein [Nocardioides sp.]HRI94061.1 DUF1254 domain-containing protein [Nocardioides sp.]HRK44132.1 DUF1254 domain-containing protein [Nocardioides sp.]
MSVLSSDVRTLAHEGYVYLYPLVTMEVSRRQQTSVAEGVRLGFGPPNQFHHVRTFPPADFRAVVRPNFDTLYSSAWLDLSGGPVQISVPDSGDRYFMLPMLDMWTDVFANPGKRTTGTQAQDIVVLPPGYAGDRSFAPGARVIEATTPHVWVIGRTQTNGPRDYAAVHAFQDGLSITELGGSAQPVDSLGDAEPLRMVNSMSAVDFFALAAEILTRVAPHRTDHDQVARLSLLGLVPGQDFSVTNLSDADRADLQAGAEDALAAITAAPSRIGTPVNGWVSYTDSMGVYGNFYLKRAMVTLVGLGANPAEDAIYPMCLTDADGEPLTGDTDYVIHFDTDQLPPAAAFWSITMYDDEGFQSANELDRFAIGDRDDLRYNSDGSLDIYIQHTNPGPDRVDNWLPAPNSPLGVTMRLYGPRPYALDGRWSPPPVHKATSIGA